MNEKEITEYIVQRYSELSPNKRWKVIGQELWDKGIKLSEDPNLQRNAVRNRYDRWRKSQMESEEAKANFDIVEFCHIGRTLSEIISKSKRSKEEVEELLVEHEGYDLFVQRNTFLETVYLYLPTMRKLGLKEKIWKYRLQPAGQPYMWVQFPKTNWAKLKIVPISDVHYGCNGHLNEKFREYVNWIANTENVFCFLNGDMVDNALEPQKGGFEQTSPSGAPQINEFVELIAPIAHKILWAQPGNHEWRTARHTNIDPTMIICNKLDIPYFSEPCYIDILWQTYRFTFFAFHGTSNSQTKGGKMNAAARPTQWQEWTMFTVSGHVHDKVAESELKMCRDTVNFELVMKKYYTVIAGSFLGYFGTYASRAGYRPGAIGTVSCDLYPNGDYHAST